MTNETGGREPNAEVAIPGEVLPGLPQVQSDTHYEIAIDDEPDSTPVLATPSRCPVSGCRSSRRTCAR